MGVRRQAKNVPAAPRSLFRAGGIGANPVAHAGTPGSPLEMLDQSLFGLFVVPGEPLLLDTHITFPLAVVQDPTA